MNKFPERLKELRKEKGLTKSQLAKEINVSHACIVFWENNTRTPTIDYIILLCHFFNVSADYLIGLVD